MTTSTDILLLGNQIGRTAIRSRNDLTRQDKMMMVVMMMMMMVVMVVMMMMMMMVMMMIMMMMMTMMMMMVVMMMIIYYNDDGVMVMMIIIIIIIGDNNDLSGNVRIFKPERSFSTPSLQYICTYSLMHAIHEFSAVSDITSNCLCLHQCI